MTEKMIENRVKKLQAIEAQLKELEAAADAIRAELKADLEEKGVEELQTKNFLLRWKETVSNRIDSKALKAALPDVYRQFCKASVSRRFHHRVKKVIRRPDHIAGVVSLCVPVSAFRRCARLSFCPFRRSDPSIYPLQLFFPFHSRPVIAALHPRRWRWLP